MQRFTTLARRSIMRLGCILLCIAAPIAKAQERSPEQLVEAFRAEQLARVVEAVQSDHDDLFGRLSALGFQDLNGFSAENVGAKPLLDHAARRAELGRRGDGERLLARLAQTVRERSAAAATDPDLNSLRTYSASQLARPFKFSGKLQRVATVTLPSVVEKAITALASYGWPHGDVATMLIRNLRKPGFNSTTLDSLALESTDQADFIRRAFAAGLPPPTPGDAALGMIAERQAVSAVLATDSAFNRIRAELRAPLTPPHIAVLLREANTPTRRTEAVEQIRAAMRERLPIAGLASWHEAGRLEGEGAAPPQLPPFSGAVPVDGGGSGGHAARSNAAFNGWDRATFSNGPQPSSGQEGGPRTGTLSRSFAVASRSVKGPGGVSLGGPVGREMADAPIAATWLPNPSEPRVGYILVKLRAADGTVHSALSRPLFAESADAAYRLVWAVDRTRQYSEGDILPLISLDDRSGRVLVNPALAGLQVAWSAVRVDFWLPHFDRVVRDALVLFPDASTASARADRTAAGDMVWWQIREKPHRLMLADEDGFARILSCPIEGPCSAATSPSGLEVALFDVVLPRCDELPYCTPEGVKTHPKLKLFVERALMRALLDAMERGLNESQAVAEGRRALKNFELRAGETRSAWKLRMAGMPSREPGQDAGATAASRYIDWLTEHHPDFIRVNDLHAALSIVRWLALDGIAVEPPGPLYAPRSLPIPDQRKIEKDGSVVAYVTPSAPPKKSIQP